MEELVKVLLVGVDTGIETDFDHSMEELASLSKACNKEVVGMITQRKESVNKAFYIGSGKVAEVRHFAGKCGAEEVIFDNTLTPSQIRNLGRELELRVLDRTNLILDIFAIRARTGEARLQVEMARLQYMLPRLVGMHEALGRQGGTGGSMSNKGAGETRLELDRRRIEHRISELRRELEDLERSRQTQRKKRNASKIPQVCLVGYTNVGKSTVLNRMVEQYGKTPDKKVLEQDMLFATLETSVRTIDTGDGKAFFLADTVGFIHKLPHGLVEAFHSTLEEVRYADLCVQVVDFSDSNYRQQMEVTKDTLQELKVGDIPQIIVYNKSDLCGMQGLPKVGENCIYMSAGDRVGLEELLEMIKQKLYADYMECSFCIPYAAGNVASYLMEQAEVQKKDYREDGLYLRVRCHQQDAKRYEAYLTDRG